MGKQDIKLQRRERRKKHIKRKLFSNTSRLRFTVYRSLGNIYAQIISDDEGKTLVSASTLDKGIKELIKPELKKIEKSKIVGAEFAKRALAANIKKVTFDRNGYLYHGRVKALADSARENGLEF